MVYRRMRSLWLITSLLFLLTGCSTTPVHSNLSKVKEVVLPTPITHQNNSPTKQQEARKYKDIQPKQWGERVRGVIYRLPTQQKVIALTFDACGGKHGSGYDRELIDYLISQRIPATLFINSRWIKSNQATFNLLAHNPLFEIENHGTEHRPLSVTGRSIYRIKGTQDVSAVYQEVAGNEQLITKLTGRAPKFFRSGTAYYDDVAVNVVKDLGVEAVNYDILGDAGATYNTSQVKRALLKAKPGSIALMHMNHPNGDTAEGIKKAIPLLKQKGYHFVKLEDYLNH
jgi:peptidoglycan/xylan/chitin deacetylase (PgdA/CDA1 family)